MVEKTLLNIDNGLFAVALFNGEKMVSSVGTFVKWEEIELNHVVVHFKDQDRYYELVQCVGPLAELKEVK